MGNRTSVAIDTANEYRLGWMDVTLKGGATALTKKIKEGDVILAKMAFVFESIDAVRSNHGITPQLRKYFTSPRFIKDLNEYIMFRSPGVAREYGIPIHPYTLASAYWEVRSAAVKVNSSGGGGWTVSFPITCHTHNEKTSAHPLPHVVAYIAGCMVWSIKSGSIPVDDDRFTFPESTAPMVVALSFSKA